MSADPPSVSPSLASGSTNGGRMAWFVLVILLLFSIAAPINQFKVPPILPIFMQSFAVSVGQAGLLMSVFAITGLVLALPAGLIFHKVGYRITSLVAGGSIVVGAVWGALSPDLTNLLASRVVEGIGTSFMAVLAPAVIAVWFRPQKRATAMGIWSAWVPIGSTAMLIIAPWIAQGGRWQPVWWFGGAYAVAVTLLAVALVKPAPDWVAPEAGAASPPALSAAQVLRHRDVWLLSLAFCCLTMAFMAMATYLPTFLNLVRGLSLAQAGLLAGSASFVSILSGPAGGMLSDRLGSRKGPYMAGLLFGAIVMPLVTVVKDPTALLILIILTGLGVGVVPTNIFSAAVEVVGNERLGGLAMGVIMVGQNAGMLLGPIIFGALAESAGGWPLAFGSLALMCLLGALAGGLAKLKPL
jgi:MFS family permease